MTETKTILIAEDDPEIIALYRLMLGSGYEILEARDGREAVEQFRAHRPDLTLMDIRMPRMTGEEAIREIRTRSPGARIIAITAGSYREEDLDVPVLRKGFNRREFLDCVARCLSA